MQCFFFWRRVCYCVLLSENFDVYSQFTRFAVVAVEHAKTNSLEEIAFQNVAFRKYTLHISAWIIFLVSFQEMKRYLYDL
jgi:hypothetical protein